MFTEMNEMLEQYLQGIGLKSYDDSEIQLQTNNEKIAGKFWHVWKLSDMLLNSYKSKKKIVTER